MSGQPIVCEKVCLVHFCDCLYSHERAIKHHAIKEARSKMGYPFYDNPLDEYLDKLFDLRFREFEASCITLDEDAAPGSRASAVKTIQALQQEIRALKQEYDLPDRTFDRYKSAAELAVERFDRENPEPPKLNISGCQHTQAKPAKRVFRNGSLHVVLQCPECGTQPRSLPKNEYDLRTLPDFDEWLYHRLTAERTLWAEARWAVYEAQMRNGSDIPEYDRTAFEDKFRKIDPAPCLESCDHKLVDARLRAYSSGGNAVVMQCVTCGHHVRTASKSKYPNWAFLSPFDEVLAKRSKEEFSAWALKLSAASRSDFQDYKLNIQQRLQRKELSWKDNSRFGTYYDSPEWARTRARIFDRDDHQCQSCKKTAECVHHILYDRLGAENDFDLISLCNECHTLIHVEQRKFHNLYRMSPTEIRSMLKRNDGDV